MNKAVPTTSCYPFSIVIYCWPACREQNMGLPSSFSTLPISRVPLSIDGQQVIEKWTEQTSGGDFLGMGGSEAQATVTLEAGRAYLVTLELSKSVAVPLGAVRLG